jgi:2-polyprenyl-3-methyl-5-hydroxy-6-metoxy-1,4-benzoquinol methylase
MRRLGFAPIGADVSAELLFALNEISEMRQQLRMLMKESPKFQAFIAQNAASFDVQWEHLPKGVHFLDDPLFDRERFNLVEKYTGLPAGWFAGKAVLDAGCGNGRWSYTIASLGARVTAIDLSRPGVEEVGRICAEFPGFKTACHNLFDPIDLDEQFDLVWNFGVGHYSGDTQRTLKNASAAVKPGGYIFTMIHGEPRVDHPGDYIELNNYVALRREVSGMTFQERIQFLRNRYDEHLVHAWFNGISPKINDIHRFDEVRDWLIGWGFGDILRTFDNRNLFIRAQRPAS